MNYNNDNEEYFYNADNVNDFSATLGVSVLDTFKYLINCVLLDTNPEDAAKFTPELLEAFENLKFNCEDFIRAFNYYTKRLEEKQ